MAVEGVRVKTHALFEDIDDTEYVGVGSITFNAGFSTMTLTPGGSGSNFTGSPVIPILTMDRIEILRETTEFPGLGSSPSV
jgi:hypothetical protein